MNHDPDHQRVRRIFDDAIEIESSTERDRFLKQACGDMQELLTLLRKLIQAHDQADELFESSRDLPARAAKREENAYKEGDTVGPCKLMRKIGAGGFGIVFLAEQSLSGNDQLLTRQVALKILRPGMANREIVDRFQGEIQSLASMDHPHVAKVYDAGETDDGLPFFAMEYVDGLPITEFCRKNELNLKQTLHLFCQVCGAIQHAHQIGIIHRDIKPSNILVSENEGSPNPKVIDFGVSKAIGTSFPKKNLTVLGQFIGTPLYMSPEQARFDGTRIDFRSDIFSLGVVLFELLTDTTPIEPDRINEVELDEIRRIIVEEKSPAPSTRVHQSTTIKPDSGSSSSPGRSACLRGDIDCIVAKALEKDRELRYETPADLADDIQRFLNGLPIKARPVTWISHGSRWVKRNKAFTVVIAVAATLLWVLAGIIFYTQFSPDSTDTNAPFNRSMAEATNHEICPWLQEECKLVLSFRSDCEIRDFDTLTRRMSFIRDLPGLLNNQPAFKERNVLQVVDDPDQIAIGEVSDDWFAWEMTVKIDDEIIRRDSNTVSTILSEPGSVVPRLRFAISRDGRFQVGTFSCRGSSHDHLIFLAQRFSGIPNYIQSSAEPDFPEYLDVDEVQSPQDPVISLGPEQTSLARYAVAVFMVFREKGHLENNSILTNHDLFEGDRFEIKNNFDRPVHVIEAILYHQHLFDLTSAENVPDLPKKIKDRIEHAKRHLNSIVNVERTCNSRWSALPVSTGLDDPAFYARNFNDGDATTETWNQSADDDDREYARLSLESTFNLPNDPESVFAFKCSSDNRNTTRITISGLNDSKSESDEVIQATGLDYDRSSLVFPSRTVIQAEQHNVSSAQGLIFDRSFKTIKLEAVQFWSVVSPSFRFVVLGPLDDNFVVSSMAEARVYPVAKYLDPDDSGLLQNAQLRPSWEPDERKPRLFRRIPVAPKIYSIDADQRSILEPLAH